MNDIITPIILAGGAGKRLWPLSRRKLPKQFHAFNGNITMLQQTIIRLKLLKTNTPIIICNNDHKFIVKDQMSQINVKCKILVEPISRNTAPAITLTALLNPEANMLILAADHLIEDEKIFKRQIEQGFNHLKNNKIVIFGVTPTSPNINYGYIQTKTSDYKNFEVLAFKEKPNINQAKKYFKQKTYFWNSGIFLFKSNSFLKELNKYSPEILDICRKTVKTISKDKDFNFFNKSIFSKCKDQSIDYAIMEYTKIALMIPLGTKWSDVGTWNTIMNISEKNQDGNVLKGNVVTTNSKNSMIHAYYNKLIATHGIKDLVVIDTKDALLICSNNEEESIKRLIDKVEEDNPEKIDIYPDENRPWGSFESISKGTEYQVKKITVKSNGKLSLQKHKYRSEHWVVVSGKAEVTKGKKKFFLNANESIYIPQGILHSLKNNEKEDLIIIEVQTGTYLGEDDIERFEDIYGRK